MKYLCAALAVVSVAAATGDAEARKLFEVRGQLTNDGVQFQSFSQGFSNARDVIEFTESDAFKQANPTYQDDFSQVSAVIDFRGLDINIAFPNLNSNVLTYSIPEIGLSGQFDGFDRDDSLEQLGDYLLENSGDILRRIQRALVRSSPNDPTAGNPNSLQSMMIAGDFSAAGFDTGANALPGGNTENRVFIGITAGTFKAQGVKGETLSVPLSYTIRYDDDPRYQLQFAMPISYLNQGGAKTGSIGFGTGFQFPLTPVDAKNQWYLTPRVSVGGVGSADAGAASILGNASVTSRYNITTSSLGNIIIANLIGYNFSIPFKVGDVKGDYGIKNLIFKNGLLYEKPLDFSLFGSKGVSVQASYALTNFTGTDLYMNNIHEVTLSIGAVNDGLVGSLMRLGVNGTFGRDFKRYSLSFGYSF